MIRRASAVTAIAAVLVSGSTVCADDALDRRPRATLREVVRLPAQNGPVLERVAMTPGGRGAAAAMTPRGQQAQRGKGEQIGRGVFGAVAGAVGGFFAGGFVGSKLEPNCRCDDPGLRGFLIGAPIGAVAGAVVGAWAAMK
jgi:hypothetical protein